PTLCHSSKSQIDTFKNFLELNFRLPKGQGIATLNRTSQNEAFNRVKLVYLDKKINYWKSYAARHALAVLHYNESVIESSYSAQQKLNELAEFDFDKELVPYKKKVLERLLNNEFYPSFALLIVDFNVTIRCIGCYVFKKCFKDNKIENEMQQDAIENEILVDKIENEMQQSEINQPQGLAQCVKIIAENIFKFKFPKPEQVDAIKYYMEDEKDTLIIMKTSSGKSFCYGNLGKLKRYFPNIQIMALIATLSYDNAIALRNDLNIDENNFRVVRENDLFLSLIDSVEETGHTIIYCARVKDCLKVFEALDQKIEKIIDVYNGQLLDSEKNDVIKR
ncbi:5222_t:CDS:2, partial [Scutellospora calospora]